MKEAVLDVLGHFNFLGKPEAQMEMYQAGIIEDVIDIINTSLDERTADPIERIASEVHPC